VDKHGFQGIAGIIAIQKETSVFTTALGLANAIWAPGKKFTKMRLDPASPFAVKHIATVCEDEMDKKFS